MKILVVSKTRMGGGLCVGALSSTLESVRLLRPDGDNQPGDTPFDIGQIWDIDCTRRDNCRPPHVEDVIVKTANFVREIVDLRGFLLRKTSPWHGGPEVLFDGHIRFTWAGRGYISELHEIPNASTGFWIPSEDLIYEEENRLSYSYQGGPAKPIRYLRYVGVAKPVSRIAAGSLVRVSLARWWKPDGSTAALEERCYLQLSGTY